HAIALHHELLSLPVFQPRVIGRITARTDLRTLRRVEEKRWCNELIEDEHHRADEQNEELHRHLDEAVETQSHPALPHALARQVTLHLRLVRSEVRQRDEETADDPRPEVVRRLEIEGEVDDVQ